MRMMQGDQYKLPISLKKSDGSFITQDDLKDLEVFIGKTRKTMSEKQITQEGNMFYVKLLQKDTFPLKGDIEIQARLLFKSGDVIGVKLGTLPVDESISKVVLV
jgi:hypothetical protein